MRAVVEHTFSLVDVEKKGSISYGLPSFPLNTTPRCFFLAALNFIGLFRPVRKVDSGKSELVECAEVRDRRLPLVTATSWTS